MILAVDIGGTKLALGVAGRDAFLQNGAFAAIAKEPIPASGTPEIVIPHVIRRARELAQREGRDITALGISIGGPLDHASGVVINFPHLPGWRNIPLGNALGEAFGVPWLLDNDANLGALAEHRWGAGRGMNDLVYLTISTGIGGGVIVGGNLLHGVGSAAGEVGHITVATGGPVCACGNQGCLEMMASGTAIARRAREAIAARPHAAHGLLAKAGGDPGLVTAAVVAEAVAAGDALACELWEETADYLAIGLGSIVHVLAPQALVLGGGVAQTGELLLGPLRRRLARHVFYVPLESISLRTAALGHDSALIGAATLALSAAG